MDELSFSFKLDELESMDVDDALSEFTLAEIMEMESLFKEMGQKSLSQEFCKEVATKFSCSTYRAGKSTVKWEQVEIWFQDKQKKLAAKSTYSPFAPLEFCPPSDLAIMNHTVQSHQKPKAERIADLPELAFEAKSAKDFAWYDVASFLSYRVLSTGELEVRVRFAGFGNQEDEWVNVRRGVRDRSIPLEPSECERVKVGDLVLCYRETQYQAIYCDAHILEIQRRLHDNQGCGCIFVVRYNYDLAEEKVELTRLCCRPT